MQRTRQDGVAAIEKSLDLLSRILEDRGESALSTLADELGVPPSTAQRMVAVFVRRGFLTRIGPGRYVEGPELVRRVGASDPAEALAKSARPLIRRLAKEISATVHFGVLDSGMVTYLVKEHGGGAPVLTRELFQLEAYCTGIGKILLAHLPAEAQAEYLASGPFVALTSRTTTDPDALRGVLKEARARGYAADNAELQDNLYCLAVPVSGPGGKVIAALSAAFCTDRPADLAVLGPLRHCAARIGRRLGARPDGDARGRSEV